MSCHAPRDCYNIKGLEDTGEDMYNNVPKKRYFNISYNYSDGINTGSGDAPYQCLGYPNRIGLKKHISGKPGQQIIIINIEELSYQDYQDYIKLTGEEGEDGK
jgi:hypothetical protein